MSEKTASETRRANLERLIAGGEQPIQKGQIAAFARTHNLDATYLSQLLNKHRTFGEKAARNMEEKCGLPKGQLDRGPALSAEALAIAELFSRLPEQRQKDLAPIIRAAIGPHVTDGEVEDKMPITKPVASRRRN